MSNRNNKLLKQLCYTLTDIGYSISEKQHKSGPGNRRIYNDILAKTNNKNAFPAANSSGCL